MAFLVYGLKGLQDLPSKAVCVLLNTLSFSVKKKIMLYMSCKAINTVSNVTF